MVHSIIFEQMYETPEVEEEQRVRVQTNKWAKQPRFSSPPSFLARVPFQAVILATTLGLFFMCSGVDATVTLGNFTQVCFKFA